MNWNDIPTIKNMVPHHNAKLTHEQVREIRKLLAEGVAPKVIYVDYDISSGALYGLRYGHTYRRVL
jgi:hypothetical protein